MKKLLLLITGLLLLFSVEGQILRYSNYTAPAPPAASNDFLTNLVAYWALEESSGTLTDSQGDADMTNDGATYGATGINGDCLDFELSEMDYIYRANTDALEMYNNDYTFAAWIYVESINDAADNGIIGAEYGGACLYISPSGNLMGGLSQYGTYLESDLAITTGTWTFVAMSVDVTETGVEILYYRNGTSDATSRALAYIPLENASSNGIGVQYTSSVSYYFDGLIDEVMMWRGRAFTEEELDDLYNSGTGLFFADFN